MFRNVALLAAPLVALVAPAVAEAGNAPIKIRNGTTQDIYVTVDATNRGLKGPTKVMKDGRTAVLISPNAQGVATETCQFDKVTLVCYDKDGNRLGDEGFIIVPLGPWRWERKWNGAKFVDD
ncbi:hypothetical protein [Frigoriglobus tundricola]|uniref:Uncharacterized protein n=1 Tax=Frigoriglobus tundricola TaxID=2774151 RepID=A0A6M5YN43_9BACT|nr:hypothetical protein [Frigoriglobus tundricola]QJW95385.1 hypothetical protein FTUN_2934 [Frigoriglobus tundricola]